MTDVMSIDPSIRGIDFPSIASVETVSIKNSLQASLAPRERGEMGMYDVVVLGAGPGGTAAARRCALNGLQTLPRDKVCTGMIMAVGSVWAERAFGAPVPESVLTTPHYDGVMVIVPGVGQREVKVDIPHGYRRGV